MRSALIALMLILPAAHAASSLMHRASFQENWQRYPSPDVILEKLRQDFPGAAKANDYEFTCKYLTDSNRTLLGDSQPMTGRPAVDNPNSAFLNWYGSCVTKVLKDDKYSYASLDKETQFEKINGVRAKPICKNAMKRAEAEHKAAHEALTKRAEEAEKKFNKEHKEYQKAVDRYVKNKTGDPPQYPNREYIFVGSYFPLYDKDNLDSCKWNFLTSAEKLEVLGEFTRRYIGPDEIIVDLGLAATAAEFKHSLIQFIDELDLKPNPKYQFLFYVSEPAAPNTLSMENATDLIKLLIHLEDINRF